MTDVITQEFDRTDYEMIEREPCFKGFFALERFHFRHKRFDKEWSRTISREVFIRGEATCILPYDPARGEVVLLEQFRAGVLLHDQNPWLIELVAGINEEGESSEDVAHREAKEEANLEIKALEPMLSCFLSPGGATEKIQLYCANVDSSNAGGVYGLAEEDEDIKVHVISLDDAAELVQKGVINNAPAVMAIQWLQLNRSKIDAKWLEGAK